MNEGFFRKMLKLKVEMAELVIDALPGPVQTPVRDCHKKVCQILYEVSKDCLEREEKQEKASQSSRLKNIVLED